MDSERHAEDRRRGLSLRALLVIVSLLQALLTAGLIGYFSYRNGRSAVDQAVGRLQQEIGARIEDHLRGFLEVPHLINRLNASAIGQGWLDLEDPAELVRHFWEQIQAFPTVSSIYLGNPSGGLVDAGREGPGGSLYVIATDGFAAGPFRKYAVDEFGQRTEELQFVPDFDARTRSWYAAAVDRRAAVWSEVYVLFSGQDMAISASLPVFNADGTLIAVVAADVFLSQIGGFLRDLKIGESSQSFIMERSGLLVASSTDLVPFSIADAAGGPERHVISDSRDDVIRAVGDHVGAAKDSYSQLTEPWHSRFEMNGDRFILRIAPLAGAGDIDWLVATVVPESAFMEQINANNRTTIAVMIAAATLALILSLSIAQWVTLPITRLKKAARDLASGAWRPVIVGSRIRDVAQLAGSLNAMSSELQKTMTDLTQEVAERERTEAALRVSESKYSLLASHATDVIWTVDLDGRFTYVSPSVEALRGYTPEEVMAEPITASLAPSSRRIVHEGLDALRRAIDAGEPVSLDERFELEQPCKDGTTVWTETALTAMYDEVGSFLGVLGVSRDITARRRAEAERLAIEAKLRQGQKLESIGTLASGIAHEINNPLTGIINYADLIEDRVENTKLREYARGILREGKRVADIVRDLLSFSRQGVAPYESERIVDLVEASLRLMGSLLRRDDIRVIERIPEDLPPVWCRGQQIEQVLINLLTNARDALNKRYPEAHDEKLIRITARSFVRDGVDWVRTTVEDRGTGIPAETLERIFDPFFTTKPRNEGTGLGLSVSYGIIQEHRGEFTVDSVAGERTRFHIDLRARKPETPGRDATP